MFVLPTIRDAYVSANGIQQEVSDEDNHALPYAMSYSHRAPEPVADLRWQPAGYPTDTMARGLDTRSNLQIEAIPAGNGTPIHLGGLEEEDEHLPVEEIQRIAALMPICLVGYFVAGWFLSRAYIMTLFIYGGMVQVIYRWALDQALAPPRLKTLKIVQYSAVGAVGLIFVVYVMLRVEHMMGH
jgi:hypothetical protein